MVKVFYKTINLLCRGRNFTGMVDVNFMFFYLSQQEKEQKTVF